MPSIVIRLEPGKLANPDLDLRYTIPDLLKKRSNGQIKDGGFDYEPKTQALLIFLKTPDLSVSLPIVLALLENEDVLENRLADCAWVGISGSEVSEARGFRVVYPSSISGTLLPPE